jgi:hypothetical protein
MKRRWLSLAVCLVFPGVLAAQSAPSVGGAVDAWLATQGTYIAPVFRQALTDLDADHHSDAIVLLTGSDWCGSGGCVMLVFRGTTAGFEFVSASTVTSEPIRVSSMRSNGWRTLIVSSKGRGDVLMPFDGTRYPPNPSLAEKATPSQARAAKTILN